MECIVQGHYVSVDDGWDLDPLQLDVSQDTDQSSNISHFAQMPSLEWWVGSGELEVATFQACCL